MVEGETRRAQTGHLRSQSGSRTERRIGTWVWEALCHSIEIALMGVGGWSQTRWPDEEMGPEGGRISRHIVQALAGTASRREWLAAILGCRGGERCISGCGGPRELRVETLWVWAPDWSGLGSLWEVRIGDSGCHRCFQTLFPPPPLSVILLFYLHNQYRECSRKASLNAHKEQISL